MRLAVYQEKAIQTIKYLGSEAADIGHMLVGMSSEINELYDAINSGDPVAIAEELADIMWYAVNLATIRKINIQEFGVGVEFGYHDLVYAISKLNDASKKFMVYNDRKKEQLEIKWLNRVVEICYNFAPYGAYVDLPSALERNIIKLHEVRYKNGYSDEAAQNRDLTAERKALEGK